MEWQPIETAPKDGTRVLLYQAGRKMCLGETAQMYAGFGVYRTGWKNTNGNFFKPTHWMPLPEPPTSDTEG